MKKLWGMAMLNFFLAILLIGSGAVAGELEDIQAAIKAKGAKWKAGETSVSKLPKEKRLKRLGLHKGFGADDDAEELVSAGEPLVGVPTYFDWTKIDGTKTFVTPVRNQGNCGSCWAFATTAALESYTLRQNNTPGIDLNCAEQVLVSCTTAGTCNGGYIGSASSYIQSTGLPLETCFPYKTNDPPDVPCSLACSTYSTSTHRIGSYSYVTTTSPTVDAIKNALYNYGPLVTTFDVYSDFYYYNSGVYRYTSGTYQGGHAVLLVGYDDLNQCFIVKNSWGTGWGEAGFFRIAYDQLHPNNTNDGLTPEGCEFGYYTIAYQGAVPSPPPACTYSASPTSFPIPRAGGSNYKITVTASGTGGCSSWTPTASHSWIVLVNPTTTTGGGQVTFNVPANTTNKNRTGYIYAAGQTITVSQKRR